MTDATLTAEESVLIRSIFRGHPEITRVCLFGSRAKGTHTSRSDIDLAIFGSLTALQAQAIASELDELPLPYKFDVVAYEFIQSPELREHIQRVGIVIYPQISSGINHTPCAAVQEIEKNFEDLTKGNLDFWTLVRETSTEKLRALVILGLRQTNGSYGQLASLFHLDMQHYLRFMDFLRRHNAHFDTRQFRKVSELHN